MGGVRATITMKNNRLKLGVNIDHIATLREVRHTAYPDVCEAARICRAAGAYCITVHLREDRRHIRDEDVFGLRKIRGIRMNLEMANIPEITAIALRVRPDEVCIVPEKRRELTTEGGLDAAGQMRPLRSTVQRLMKAGILVSLFIDADRKQIKAASLAGAPCIELHTGSFCDAKGRAAILELHRLIKGAAYAHSLGLQVNAGHGINLNNIGNVLKIPYLDVLNIGHSIVCRSIVVGLKAAVAEMMKRMAAYRSGGA
jgi:pyridoxine 5-phosphate synthase